MSKGEKSWRNYIMLVFVVMVLIGMVIRICGNTTQNQVFGVSGRTDGNLRIADASFLELEFDTPIGGLTGFSFHFHGDWKNFGDSKFWVQAEIQKDGITSQILYRDEIALIDQAYDYQNECFKAMIPFNGDIKPGDHLRIAIMGKEMAQEDGIVIETSSQIALSGTTFEVNDFKQKNVLVGDFYYQTEEKDFFPILMQSGVFILLILLVWELWKNPGVKRKLVTQRPIISYKERLLRLLPIIILLAIALDYTYYAGVKGPIQNIVPADGDIEDLIKNASYIELCDGEAIFEEWRVESDHLGGLGIYLKDPYDDNGIFTITVIEVDSQDVVAETQTAIYEMEPEENGLYKINFGCQIKKSAGMEYIVSIFYSGAPIEFLALNNGENAPLLVPLYRDNLFLNPLFFIYAVLITGFTVIFFLCVQNRMKVEKLFFISVVFLGILFETVITPFAVPDEAAHIDTAYRISNQILGIEDSRMRDAIYKRKSDIFIDSGDKRVIGVESYRWLYEDWFNAGDIKRGELTFASDTRANADSLYFLPSAISITIGRILGIGFLPMIFFARTANLLLASWLLYQALKKLPFGKSVLCVVVLLPLTLQEIASCSYDCLIIAVSILYVSYCVFAIYSKDKLRRSEILVILITAIMLGLCKGGVYTPLYILALWVLKKRGYIRLPQKKVWKAAGIGVILIAGGAVITALVSMLRTPVEIHSLRNGYYPLAYLLQHPIETFRIAENTLYQGINSYLTQFIGNGLGSFQIGIKFIVPTGYIWLVGEAVISDEKHSYIVDAQNKILFLTAALLSAGAIHLAMLLALTNFGNPMILGVQARYFIPVLWLILISLRCGKVIHKKKAYRRIVWSGYILGICTVLQIMIEGLAQ